MPLRHYILILIVLHSRLTCYSHQERKNYSIQRVLDGAV